jgi:hypothetical protein
MLRIRGGAPVRGRSGVTRRSAAELAGTIDVTDEAPRPTGGRRSNEQPRLPAQTRAARLTLDASQGEVSVTSSKLAVTGIVVAAVLRRVTSAG